jgi:hypothetical protein
MQPLVMELDEKLDALVKMESPAPANPTCADLKGVRGASARTAGSSRAVAMARSSA